MGVRRENKSRLEGKWVKGRRSKRWNSLTEPTKSDNGQKRMRWGDKMFIVREQTTKKSLPLRLLKQPTHNTGNT